jgi:hypothetical protein
MSQTFADTKHEEDSTPALDIDSAQNVVIRKAINYWHSVCGARSFPARSDLTLRGLANVLRYTVIVSVIEAGADYEYRFVGDAEREAYKTDFKGVRLSAIEATAPKFGAILRTTYERVRSERKPILIRARVDHPSADEWLPFHETVFFPLGVTDNAVDHILIVSIGMPDPGLQKPDAKANS